MLKIATVCRLLENMGRLGIPAWYCALAGYSMFGRLYAIGYIRGLQEVVYAKPWE